MSPCSRSSLWCVSSTPPARWTSALGRPGRAGRIEHRERVIERQADRRQRSAPSAAQPVGPRDGRRGPAIASPQDDDARRSREARGEIGDDAAGVEALAVVGIATTTRAAASARSGGSARRRRRRRSRASRTRRSRRAPRRRGAGSPPPGTLATKAATVSPRPMPSRASAAAARATASAQLAAREITRSSPASLVAMMAGASAGRAAAGEQRLGVVQGDAVEPARGRHRRAVVRGCGGAVVREAALAQAASARTRRARRPTRRAAPSSRRAAARPPRRRRGRRRPGACAPPASADGVHKRRHRGRRRRRPAAASAAGVDHGCGRAVRRVADARADRDDGARAGQHLAVALQAELDAIAAAGLERVLGA